MLNDKDKPKQTPPLPFQKPEPLKREDSGTHPPPIPQPPENPFQHPDPLKKNAQDIPPKRDGRG
jgi:hypothetical protein